MIAPLGATRWCSIIICIAPDGAIVIFYDCWATRLLPRCGIEPVISLFSDYFFPAISFSTLIPLLFFKHEKFYFAIQSAIATHPIQPITTTTTHPAHCIQRGCL
jgi:hypothetical protein